MNQLNIVALIPARCESKGIINKNIKLYKGIPLLAHSIKLAKECSYIKDVYLSTDSEEYQKIGLEYGSSVMPLRPKSISDDLSPDIDCFNHLLEWIKGNNMIIPDIIVHLRPTYPNRTINLLNNCIEIFLKNYNNYDSLRTVIPFKKTPYKMYYIDENNNLTPYIKTHQILKEPYNQARQNFPDTYIHNGCIDIVNTNIIIKDNLLSGNKILPFIMDEHDNNDIDDLDDFANSEKKYIK
jgi:N-acylneuraminate cytidylyltransferase